jgi:urease accessory protein UreH
MDCLYEELRTLDYNRRLEISRNFARILLERKEFKAQDRMHRVEIAETSAIKLREVLTKQKQEKEYIDQIRRKAAEAKKKIILLNYTNSEIVLWKLLWIEYLKLSTEDCK